jgi:FdhD protein
VNWSDQLLEVCTIYGKQEWQQRIRQRLVTTGCGHGTVIKHFALRNDFQLPVLTVNRSLIDTILQQVNTHNEVYRQAGGVHGCALCQGPNILAFVEDVGRHNATDTMAGLMWLQNWSGEDKMFYTTGRLTAEMVIKVAQLGIPILLSRSGVTAMGIQLAQEVGMTLIASAKGQHFLVFNGEMVQ